MHPSVAITADSTCDLSHELIEKYDLQILPLYIQIGNDTLHDGLEATPEMVFDCFCKLGELPKTSAVTITDYAQEFTKLRSKGKEVVHISISSEFSSSYQNACLAARDIGGVWVLDSRNLSTGSGHLALLGAELARAGKSAQEIYEELKKAVSNVEASFVLDTLAYLRKGGRCSAVAALGANLLHVKPSIEVAGGLMTVGKKYRGSLEKSIMKYIADKLSGRQDIDYKRIFITHTIQDNNLITQAIQAVQSYGDFEEILVTKAGCTVSSHCGPGTLGVLFLRKPAMG